MTEPPVETKSQPSDLKRIYCNQCRQGTNHKKMGYYSTQVGIDDEESVPYAYTLWMCAGCDPERRDTRLAIEVIEDLLNFFYELDYKATRLRKSKKKRKGIIVYADE